MSCPELAAPVDHYTASRQFWYKGTIAFAGCLRYNEAAIQENKTTMKGGEKNAVSAA